MTPNAHKAPILLFLLVLFVVNCLLLFTYYRWQYSQVKRIDHRYDSKLFSSLEQKEIYSLWNDNNVRLYQEHHHKAQGEHEEPRRILSVRNK